MIREIDPREEPDEAAQAVQEWWDCLRPGERLWRLDIGRSRGPGDSPSRQALAAGDLALSRELYYDDLGLGDRGKHDSMLKGNIAFINQARRNAAQGCQTDRLMIVEQGEAMAREGMAAWLINVVFRCINTPFGHENDYVLDKGECEAACRELGVTLPAGDLNLVGNRKLMGSDWDGVITLRRFCSAAPEGDDEEDEQVQQALLVRQALDPLLDENHRIKGIPPPRDWPHDTLQLAAKL